MVRVSADGDPAVGMRSTDEEDADVHVRVARSHCGQNPFEVGGETCLSPAEQGLKLAMRRVTRVTASEQITFAVKACADDCEKRH